MANKAPQPLHDPLLEEEDGGETLASPVAGEEEYIPEKTGTASLKATIFNLINTVIGAGLLALPQAVYMNGIVIGVGLIILVAVMSDVSINMLLYAADAIHETNFGRISELLAGKTIKQIVDLTIFLLNFGLCTSYCIIIGDNLQFYAQSAGAAHGSPWQEIQPLILGVVVLILYPLSTMKDMNALRHVSLLCLTFITLFVVLIIVASTGAIGMKVAVNASAINWFDTKTLTGLGMLQNVPVIFFAYVCHMNVPLLYGELKRPSRPDRPSKWKSNRSKMMCAVHVSLGYCCMLYCAVAVCGYILYGDVLMLAKNAGNILNAIHSSDLVIAPYVKLVYALLLALSYPCTSYSGRTSLHRMMASCCPCMDKMGDNARFITGGIFVACTAGVAMTGLSVSVAFGLTGSITCSALMYIFPGAFHYIAVKKHGRGVLAKSLSIGTIGVGCAVLVASTVAIIIQAINPGN
jgi:sodium-coupled neutral amino acid transporter 2